MELQIDINSVLRKKNWDIDKCENCQYRFACLTGGYIFVQSIYNYNDANRYVAKFRIPRCIRIGLLKNEHNKYVTLTHEDDDLEPDQIRTKLPDIIEFSGMTYWKWG